MKTADLQEHCFSKLLTISKYLQPFCLSPIDLWTIWLIPAKLERGVEVMEITSTFIKTGRSWRLDTREPGRSRGSKRTSMAMTAAGNLAQWWALETSVFTWVASLHHCISLLGFLLDACWNRWRVFLDRAIFFSAPLWHPVSHASDFRWLLQ